MWQTYCSFSWQCMQSRWHAISRIPHLSATMGRVVHSMAASVCPGSVMDGSNIFFKELTFFWRTAYCNAMQPNISPNTTYAFISNLPWLTGEFPYMGALPLMQTLWVHCNSSHLVNLVSPCNNSFSDSSMDIFKLRSVYLTCQIWNCSTFPQPCQRYQNYSSTAALQSKKCA